ncbi:hypothetical protein OK351_11295 [Glutamicibacter sp. MNS18]|uniref:ABC transporter permease n=1 Tax=Glutamicibacter sp. MNS18 TaxID=2989817 RepID=UPI002236842A|nr:hypothetical protein [Glutamicibacter sp. MNS18]MCW4466087.1 hypothetical protein [Glutamicibacter sp. MNS18]
MSARGAGRHALPTQGTGTLAGAGVLWRSMLRTSRWGIAIWALALVGLLYYMALAVNEVLGAQGLQARAAIIGLPAGAMLSGPGYGLDNYTLEVMVANELLGLYAVMVGIMSLRLAVRHTRTDEEAGRTELLRALPVGRLAPVTAALATCLLANVVVSGLMLAALLLLGFPLPGSVGFCLGLMLVGLVFAAIGALCAQLSSSARTAASLAGAVLALAYLLRAVGDASEPGGNVLSWLTPVGWIQQQRLFVEQRWWPLLLVVAMLIAVGLASFLLQQRREVGAGLLPQRAGRDRARALGRRVIGVGARLDRGRLFGWTVSILVAAVLTGSLAGPVADAFRDLPQLQAVLGLRGGQAALQEIVVAAMATFLVFFAMVVAIFAVQGAHRLRRDESLGRVELLLATAVSRWWVMGSQLLLNVAGCAWLLVIAGFGLGVGAQPGMGEAVLGTFIAAALWNLPVVACWLALSMLALGLGRGAVLVWIGLVACIVVGMYGPLLNLPQSVLDAEPFTSVNALEIVHEQASMLVPAGYALAAAILAALALILYSRRDLGR